LQPGQQGYAVRADPAHKRVNPVLYRVDEALACWAAIEAPVLWVASDQRDAFHEFTRTQEYRRRLTVIRRLEEVEVADAGHMLHHDQPARIAALIEEFFSR
jgi:pimeloyl-ACP methyl ester carboxylesterase